VAVTKPGRKRRGAKVLYISYDGLTDPLGRSQILPYLAGLSAAGHRITVLSCEKPERIAKEGFLIRRLCDQAEIHWHPLKYHKQPAVLSSTLDAALLQRAAVSLHRENRYDLAHCRSYIPARAGLALKRRFGVRLLFDMRGFWPDEKVEGNAWNLANPLYAAVYRYFKRLEARLLCGADHIVSLTRAGQRQLVTRPELKDRDTPISVIPCCVDFDHFPLTTHSSRDQSRKQLAIEAGAPVLAYLGSLGAWYMLGEMLDFFKVYASRRAGARFLLVTLDDPRPIRQAASSRGVDPNQLIIRPATRDEVPLMMTAADLGIFFIKPVFSKTASSPTKMGEMLAVGLPIVTNSGVGDVAPMVDEMGCGVAVGEFAPGAYASALDRLDQLDGSAGQRRDRARSRFDVELGIEQYDRIYRELLG
jgi:glycosyltransferase involved in cell wall biosynthesis